MGDTVLVGAWDWFLYALDRKTGVERWSAFLGSDALSSPITDGETVLQVTEEGRVVALDLGSGEELWDHRLDVRAVANPTVKDGHIFVPLVNGDLVALRGL